MNSKLTREELDAWLRGMAGRLMVEAETAAEGDFHEIVAGEIEVIEPRVAAGDADYLHQQALDVIEAMRCIRASAG